MKRKVTKEKSRTQALRSYSKDLHSGVARTHRVAPGTARSLFPPQGGISLCSIYRWAIIFNPFRVFKGLFYILVRLTLLRDGLIGFASVIFFDSASLGARGFGFVVTTGYEVFASQLD